MAKSSNSEVAVSEGMTKLLGNVDGVEVDTVLDGGVVVGFEMHFEYDVALVDLARRAGGEFKEDIGNWVIPIANQEAFVKALPRIRSEAKAIEASRNEIMSLAKNTAVERQIANGADQDVQPRISDFREAGRAYTGEIINANGYFAAQLTSFGTKAGFDKNDVPYKSGAAFVTIHRQASLDRNVNKGEDIGIKYSTLNKAVTFDTKSKQVEDYESSLGKKVDGVTVNETDSAILVSFGYNPSLRARLDRIAGVEFDVGSEAFKLPLSAKGNVVRAVADMRTEFLAAEKDFQAISTTAHSLYDNPKVSFAFVKNGYEHSGKIKDVNDRFILQEGRVGDFKVHHRSGLDMKDIKIGQNLDIKYNRGIGAVIDRDLKKAQENLQSKAR